jgi:two-component system LytT family sensor kinase
VEYDLRMEQGRIFPHARGWLWIAAIWLGIGLFSATQTVFGMRAQGMHHAWPQLFLTQVLALLPWALATPIVQYLGRRFPPIHWKPFSTWLVHLAACAAIGLLTAAWIAGLEELMNPWAVPSGSGPFVPLFWSKFYNNGLSDVVLYASILAISYVLDSKERLARQQTETARLSEALSKAQVYALRRQLEPHFLFNALNSISGLVREKKNDAAVSMIAGLSDFLRRVFEDSNRQEVPLGEEMDFVQKYLDIQKIRFADRLKLDVQVPGELLSAQVPTLILQPMAENAVKHGIAKRANGGTIRISAWRSAGMLNLTVYNDGPKHRPGPTSGIGISNVRSRLERLYGNKFQLTMRDQEPDGVEVSVSVPFKEK